MNNEEYSVVKVQKDGNCFFTCRAVELYEDTSRHQKVRSADVDYMCNKAGSFSYVVDRDFDQHMQNMRQTNGHTKTWAILMCYAWTVDPI